jgi:hypothetical protein
LAAPNVVAGKDTPVTFEFTPPAGARLAARPRLRVVDPKGALIELLPCHLDRQPPNGQARRTLRTAAYPTGRFELRAEVDYFDAGGRHGQLVSPAVTFSIASR